MSLRTNKKLNTSQSFINRDSLEILAVQKTIEMLKSYEDSCLKKGKFFEAEMSKNRIAQLKEQKLKYEHEQLKIKNKQNLEQADRINDQQIRQFHETWQAKMKQNLQQYKLMQQNMKEQHETQLLRVQQTISAEQPPKIKYSPNVLKKRNHLQNLIKCRQYIEAEYVTQQIQLMEQEENELWIHKFEEKKKKQFEQLIKKQEIEMRALKIKIKTLFNEKMKQKDQLFNKLLNKTQKRRVQSNKSPIELKLKQQKIKRTINSGSVISRSTSKHKYSLMESRNQFSLHRQ